VRYGHVLVVCALASTGCFLSAKRAAPVHDARRDARDLVRLEEDLHAAYLGHDAKFVAQVLSDDFLAIDPKGNSYDRNRQLAELTAPRVCEYITPYDLRVRVYGDAAVVTGRTRAKCRADGGDLEVSTRWTDVFVRRDSRWRWVSAQSAHLTAP
jgi:ketosteroid isomerase-like protein